MGGHVMLSDRSQTRKDTQCRIPCGQIHRQKQVSGCQALGEGREGLTDNRQCFGAERVLQLEIGMVG